jgi:hypothetical protein
VPGIAKAQPLPPDDDQHGRGFLERALQHLDEIGARLDGFDVEEDAIGAEALLQMIGEPSGLAGRVVAAIADEDRGPVTAAAPPRPGRRSSDQIHHQAGIGIGQEAAGRDADHPQDRRPRPSAS